MKTINKILTGLFMLGYGAVALAVPTLQLNIEGGFYDTTDETIVTTSNVFTVHALAKVDDFQLILDEPVYLAIAITPKQAETMPDIGSFKVGSDTYTINELMYGIPPIENAEAIFDGGDLGKHSIYETYFLELAFNFDASVTVAEFNTQDDAGATPTPATEGKLLYLKEFEIDASGLLAEFNLHFDLYNTHVKNSRNCSGPEDCDFDINDFAPFSHDAGTVRVPEPNALALLGMGLLFLGLINIRNRVVKVKR